MSKYVITIAPEQAAEADRSTQTTVRVDTSTGQTRITEVTIRAGGSGGLAPADLPAVDLELLLRALTAPTPAALPAAEPATAVSAEPAEAAAEPVAVEPEAPTAVVEGTIAEATETPAQAAAESTPARRPRRAKASRPAAAAPRAKAAPAKKTATKKAAPAKKAAAAKKTAPANKASSTRKATGEAAAKSAGRKAKSAAAAAASAARPYRKMPEPAEVMAAYAEAGSITGLAEHYGVPRHTVAGWARRLRSLGHSIGRQ